VNTMAGIIANAVNVRVIQNTGVGKVELPTTITRDEKVLPVLYFFAALYHKYNRFKNKGWSDDLGY